MLCSENDECLFRFLLSALRITVWWHEHASAAAASPRKRARVETAAQQAASAAAEYKQCAGCLLLARLFGGPGPAGAARKECEAGPGLLWPCGLFTELCGWLGFDASVLLDWLTSDETPFLEYLLHLLRACRALWPAALAQGPVAGMLSALRRLIERLDAKGLFPYRPAPLLRHLAAIEQPRHTSLNDNQRH